MMRLLRRRLLAGVAAVALLGSGVGEAAVTANSIVTAQTPNRGIVQFLQGTDTAGTYKTLYTAGANGSVCKAIWENNNDASATHLITIQVVNSTVKYGGVSFTTTSNEGFASGTNPFAVFSNPGKAGVWPGLPTDQNNNQYLFLANGDTLQATFATALTASDLINLGSTCSDF